GVLPVICIGTQFLLPYTSWPLDRTSGAAARIALHWVAIASQSWGVSVMTLPAPQLTPPLAAWPGCTSRLLAPRLAMARALSVETPLPISIIAITALIPITIPTQVSSERITLRRSARTDVCNVRTAVLMLVSPRAVVAREAPHRRCP